MCLPQAGRRTPESDGMYAMNRAAGFSARVPVLWGSVAWEEEFTSGDGTRSVDDPDTYYAGTVSLELHCGALERERIRHGDRCDATGDGSQCAGTEDHEEREGFGGDLTGPAADAIPICFC